MQIGKILFPVTTLGPGRRVGIWTRGCTRFCKGCSNPELQTFDAGSDISPEKIFEAVEAFDPDGVTVSGGEPFLYKSDLKRLIELLRAAGHDDILVYTGYTLKELYELGDENVDYILTHAAAIIDGPYIEELSDGLPLRGSSNQHITVIDKRFAEGYELAARGTRKADIFYFDDEVHFIGVPPEGYRQIYSELVKARRPK